MCVVLNEERNIERYCEVYSKFADTILICDGGSVDQTVELAEAFPKADVVHFDGLMDFDGHPWTPLGEHHNFAYDAAMKHDPDWIITDEADSLPTLALQKNTRSNMAKTDLNIIGVGRMYILGSDQYFPELSFGGYFGWAHRPSKIDGHYGTERHLGIPRPLFPHPNTGLWQNLDPPMALLHYGWPDDETVAAKLKRYRASGSLPPYGTPIPDEAGETVDLPEWAEWN